MDQKQIEDLVRRVMTQLQNGDAGTGGQSAASGGSTVSEGSLPDLGSD